MIVTCTGCRTRFRVADEKVGPKGALLRCTRCKVVFSVPPLEDSAVASALGSVGAGGAPQVDDPFAAMANDDPFLAAATAPAPVLAPDAGALSLEEPDRRAVPTSSAPFEEQEAPPPAPGLLDFGAFDFGDPADEPLTALATAPAVEASADPLAGLSVDDLGGPASPPMPVAASPAASPPPPAPAGAALPGSRSTVAPDLRQAERPARRPLRLGALGVNALSLAALVLVAAAMFTSWRGRLGGPFSAGAAASLAARATSSGLYDTAAGRPVLVIRGEVRSSLAEPVAARVQVELVDGGRVVARGVAAPGAVPTPEEAWAIDGAVAGERLSAALAARAPARLSPGETAPFGVVLADVPPGAERLTVRVNAATTSR